jgi:hypothetical protein
MAQTQFPTLAAPLARAEAGAAFLDQAESAWTEHIDLATLDIGRGHLCILGQLGAHLDHDACDRNALYLVAADAYGLNAEAILLLGFTGDSDDLPLLTTAWITVIHRRRALARRAGTYRVDDLAVISSDVPVFGQLLAVA